MSASSVKNIKKLFLKHKQHFSPSPTTPPTGRTNSTTVLTNTSSIFSKSTNHKPKKLTYNSLSHITFPKKRKSNVIIPNKTLTHTYIQTHKTKSISPKKANTIDHYQRLIYKNGLLNLNINSVLKSIRSDIKQRNNELKLSRNKIFNKKMQIKPTLPYPFIVNTEFNNNFISSTSFSNTTKFNTKSKGCLRKEAKNVFEHPYSLIKPKSKYNTIINYDTTKHEEHNKIKRYKKEMYLIGKKLQHIFFHKEYFSNLIYSYFKDNKLNTKNDLFNKIKRNIIRAANHFQRMKISLIDYFSKYKPITTPLTDENTQLLINAIKNQNINQCKCLLNDNRGIVLDYDYFKQTPLHWAAKRNFFSFIPELIKYGASVDAKDCLGQSAVHIAVKLNHFESALFLFMETASPFVIDIDGKRPIDYCQSLIMKSLCDRATLLHVVHSIGKQKEFYQNVKRGFVYFVRHELPYDIFIRVYKIVLGDKEEKN